jgi:hypothetical protein
MDDGTDFDATHDTEKEAPAAQEFGVGDGPSPEDQHRLAVAQAEEQRLLQQAIQDATSDHLQGRVLNLAVAVQQKDDRIVELVAERDALLAQLSGLATDRADPVEPEPEEPTP